MSIHLFLLVKIDMVELLLMTIVKLDIQKF